MAERNLNTALKKRLINNEAFVYAHLIKYERPYPALKSGKHSTDAKRYAYLTDGAVNIDYNDGTYATDGTTANGTQTYIANKISKIGSYSETVEAKATGMTLTLSAESLHNSITSTTITMTSSTIIVPSSIDLVAEGFREGDKISITGGTNDGHEVRITGIKTNNTVLTVSNIDSTLATQTTGTSITIKIVSDEIKGPLIEMDNDTLKSYHNRDVFIYKAFLDPDDYTIIGAPILIFKGIIASTSIRDNPNKNLDVQWKLTSHWGDFAQVNGRPTNDAIHRAIDENGMGQPTVALKEIYAEDFGFQHADVTLSTMSTYKYMEKVPDIVSKRAGLFGFRRKYTQIWVDEEREATVDLNWALSAKYLPVVYGVDKVDGIPIFVDTEYVRIEDGVSMGDPNEVYVAYAICEGEIGGIYDFYFDDHPRICTNLEDYDTRGDHVTDVEADVTCLGRADQGTVLGGKDLVAIKADEVGVIEYSDNILATLNSGGNFHIGSRGTGKTKRYDRYIKSINAYKSQYGLDRTADTGILHEQTHNVSTPNNMFLTLHSGLTYQRADDTLNSIANGDIKFRRQTDYYNGPDYWTPWHTLADTAYVVVRCNIGKDDESVPETKYVVRGKLIDCYNYDFSYKHHDNREYADESGSVVSVNITDNGKKYTGIPDVVFSAAPSGGTTATGTAVMKTGNKRVDSITITNSGEGYKRAPIITFGGAATYERIAQAEAFLEEEDNNAWYVGDTVGLYDNDDDALTNDDDEAQTAVVIIDKWKIVTDQGKEEWRWRFSEAPGLDYADGIPTITSFYMKKGDDEYHFATANHIEHSGTVPSKVNASGKTSINANEEPIIEFETAPSWIFDDANTGDSTFPLVNGIEDELVQIAFTGSQDYAGNSYTAQWDDFGELLTIQGTSSEGYETSGDDYNVEVIRTDAIQLANDAAGGSGTGFANDDQYNDMRIKLTILDTSGDYTVQERKIIDYDGVTQIAQIDIPWDKNNFPESDGSYTYTYEISAQKDERVSTNPAIQLLDYTTSQTYGKRLNIDSDIEIGSWLSAARACDSRGTQTCTITGTPDIVAGDRYILTSDGLVKGENNYVRAMGMVKTSVDAATSVEFEEVWGKFTKSFMPERHSYFEGDIIYNYGGYYRVGTAGVLPNKTKKVTVNTTGEQETITLNNTSNITADTGGSGGDIVFGYGIQEHVTVASKTNSTVTLSSAQKLTAGTRLYFCTDASLTRLVSTFDSDTVALASGTLSNGTYTVVAHSATSGSGSGMTVTMTIASNATTAVTIVNPGQGYAVDDTITFTNQNSQTNSLVLTLASIVEGIPLHRLSGTGPAALTLSKTDTDEGFYVDTTEYSLYNSDFIKYWRQLGWESHHQRWVTRHQLCTTIDTSNSVFNNINGMLQQFNGILSFEAGKYTLRIETESDDTEQTSDTADGNDTGYTKGVELNSRYITDDNIIGAIKVADPGPKKSYNTVSSTISDPGNKFEGKQVSFYDSEFLKADKNIIKSGNFSQPSIHNYYNARINVENYLKKSRYQMKVNFTLGPRGLLLRAGDIIAITYEKFGWSAKQFRIENLNFKTNCTVDVSASEYHDSFYSITAPSLESNQIADSRPVIPFSLSAPHSFSATAGTSGDIDIAWKNATNIPDNCETEIWKADGTVTATETTAIKSVSTKIYDEVALTKVTKLVGAEVDSSTTVYLNNIEDLTEGMLVRGTTALDAAAITISSIVPGATDDDADSITLSASQSIDEGTALTFIGFGEFTYWDPDDDQVYTFWARHKYTTIRGKTYFSAFTDPDSATTAIPDTYYSLSVRPDAQVWSTDSDSALPFSPTYITFTPTTNLTGDITWTTTGDVSNSVDLYTHPTTGSAISAAVNNATPIYLRDEDVIANGANTTVSVIATITSSDIETGKGAASTYSETVTIPKITAGSTGKMVRLRSSSLIFKKDPGAADQTNEAHITPDYIQFDAVKQNTTANAYWQITDDSPAVTLYTNSNGTGAVTEGTTSGTAANTVYLLKSQMSTNAEVLVTLTCDSITDSATIIALEHGSHGLAVVLSNEAHVIPADEDGVAESYTGSGTNIRIYEGDVALSYEEDTLGAGEFTVAAALTVGGSGNLTIGGSNPSDVIEDQGTYAQVHDHSAASDSVGLFEITYTLTGKRLDGVAFNAIERVQTISKVNTGETGETGDDSKSLQLDLNKIVIGFDYEGNLKPDGATQDITCSCSLQNIGDGDPTYQIFAANGSSTQNDLLFSNASATITAETATIDASTWDTVSHGQSVVVKASLVYDSETYTSNKSVTALLEGAPGYSLTPSSNNHTFQGSATGVVTNNNFTNTFTVKRGNTTLSYNATTSTSDTWSFSVGPTGSGGVATNKINNSSGVLTIDSDCVLLSTGTSTLEGGISGTIVDNNGSDSVVTIGTFEIQLVKSLLPAVGDVGLRTANGYLYYNTLQASAPSAPSNSNVEYAFATGLLSGGVIGSGATNWNQNAPTSSGGLAASKMWYVYWSTIEDTAGGGTGTTVTLGSTVYNAHNFVGLVRFSGTNTIVDGSGGTISLGSGGTTTIDGDAITTGTVDAARIDTDLLRITGTNFTGEHQGGEVGGWTLASDAIYSGTKDTTGYTGSNGHITICSSGSIHTPAFFVETDGTAGFKGTVTIGGTDLTTNNALNANTTAGDVGLGNVNNVSQSTIQAATLSAADADDVGLGNVTNASQSTIQAATLSAADADDVGLGNVDNTSDASVLSSASTASNSQNKTGGSVGGLSLASDKMYIGTGTINNANTAFYVDNTGKMSLKDKLYWDGTTLNISGNITVGNASTVRTALNVADGSTANSTDAQIREGTTKANVGLTNVQDLNAQNQAQTGLIAGTTITGGGITLSSGGSIKGGQSAYNSGSGFFLGYESSQYKFSIGDGSSNKLTWDGTTLTVAGSITVGDIEDGEVGGWEIDSSTISSDNITLDSTNNRILISD